MCHVSLVVKYTNPFLKTYEKLLKSDHSRTYVAFKNETLKWTDIEVHGEFNFRSG